MSNYSHHQSQNHPGNSYPDPMPSQMGEYGDLPGSSSRRAPRSKEHVAAIPDPGLERTKRRGFHPIQALAIAAKSGCFLGACTNVLWPFVPIGIALHFVRPEWHLWVFVTNYVAMVPTANLLAFSSAGLARKIPRVLGVVLQVTVASVAALLGSMLANLLLCTGLCFVIGGIRTKAQEFGDVLAETGGGLLLLSVAALTLPAAFYEGLSGLNRTTAVDLTDRILSVSRYMSILLVVAYALYLFFQLHTHHHLFDRDLYHADQANKDRRDNVNRAKLTITESLLFVIFSLTLVCLHSIFMVEQIHWIVSNRHVSDAFMGLILVPLVEKAAEHLSAVDEAWDNAMDFALSHILGSTIQTALFVAPIVIIIGWIAGRPMDLNFEVFMVVVLVFSVLVVGNFIKDGKSNYLEGALCCIFYLMISVTTWYYPNPPELEAGSEH
ncbi:uncharacterized protein LAJ45_05639 [Morchella importuna]|uniref:uncharacterized protein n=1 Tax=Morchella importuna TaxID=1174673 RepID=UPI001E8D2B65|nr:uncharacterized protein LAJ45_05639 [Morchella importuna]KAH8150427.1 hypothetical protein LAJ45_05639 [Morchella importuna]